MAEQKQAGENGQAKPAGRGISYPFIPLEAAVSRAKAFWDAERKNAAPLAAAVKHWGYGEKSSGGKQTAAALIHYGLMEDSGSLDSRLVKLTDRALRVLLDEEQSPGRWAAIREAAANPKIYAELLNRWPAAELPSDQTLRFFLLREKDFNPNTVDDFIKDFRATIAFAKLAESSNIPSRTPSNEAQDPRVSKELIGSHIQWESGGVVQFVTPRKVIAMSDDGKFVFVEGSTTGIPVAEVETVKTPDEAKVEVVQQPLAQAGLFKQDVFSLDEGQVILQWPTQLSPESYEDFKAWIELQVKKIGRAVRG